MKLLYLLLLVACSTSPTGRKQLKLISKNKMRQMGVNSFEQLKQHSSIITNDKINNRLRCISDRLLTSMNQSADRWEVLVFKNDTPNAFALPGNKIGVHTGMLDIVKNDDQLAAVIGHEIGHVLAGHGNERVSQGMLTQGVLIGTSIALGSDATEGEKLAVAALGLGATYGIILPFSREHESEADQLGIKYMAQAGFDPREAAELWKVMQTTSSGAPPEFLSTHPSTESRIANLSSLAPLYMSDYNSSKDKVDSCSN